MSTIASHSPLNIVRTHYVVQTNKVTGSVRK